MAGQKEVNATGRSFTVRSSVHLKVDRKDDGAAYTCVVEHIALGSLPHQVTEVLEVHCESYFWIIFPLDFSLTETALRSAPV